MNVTTLRKEDANALALNEIGRVRLESMRPLQWDPYGKNRSTGSFILIDRMTNATVAAGMILDRTTAERATDRRRRSGDAGTNLVTHASLVSKDERAKRLHQEPLAIWFTGLPRSGKTPTAFALEQELYRRGYAAHVLLGTNLRTSLSRDLGFSGEDRWEHQRRAAEVAKVSCDAGLIAIGALIAPLASDRAQARAIIGAERFVEVYCSAPLSVCEQRDTTGLYAAAREGQLRNVTGIDAPYEPPTSPDFVLPTGTESPEACAKLLCDFLEQKGLLKKA